MAGGLWALLTGGAILALVWTFHPDWLFRPLDWFQGYRFPAVMFGSVGVLLIVGLPAELFVRWGTKMRLPDAWSVLEADPRPPVVFLRPFSEDRSVTTDRDAQGSRFGGERLREQGVDVIRTPERMVAEALKAVGPFVAIGKPGERLATQGAARLYVSDKHWKETVAGLVRLASAVVLYPKDNQSVRWELEHIMARVQLTRLLLLVPDPSLRPFAYAAARKLVEDVLRIELPDVNGGVSAFMFDNAGRAHVLSFGTDARFALEPFIRQIEALSAPATGATA
jgi:hypothetical protein